MKTKQPTSLGGALTRIFWIIAGPGCLSITAITITQTYQGWLAPRSIAYLAILAAIILARWFDPLDSDGEPTTPDQRRRTALFTLSVGLIGWVAVNLIGKYLETA